MSELINDYERDDDGHWVQKTCPICGWVTETYTYVDDCCTNPNCDYHGDTY